MIPMLQNILAVITLLLVSAEPVTPDGTSPVGVRTGCYDFDEDVYCIGDMDTAILILDFLKTMS